MADGSATFNTDVSLVPKDAGVVNVSIVSAVGQGNGGTSLPCKRVYVQGALSNAGYVMMNVNAAATSVVGICLPGGIGGGTPITTVISAATLPPPLELEIDDVNKLYFSGTTGDIVNILYRR